MRKFKSMISFLFIVSVLSSSGCGMLSDDDDNSSDYILSAGFKTGNYYKFSKGFVYAMDEAWSKKVKLIESEGSYENLQNLIRGKADFAIVQEDVLEKVRRNPSSKEDIEISANIDVLCVGYLETVHLLVNTNNVKPAVDTNNDGVFTVQDITVTDLKNKIVNIGSTASGSYVTAINVLTANNVQYTPKELSSKDAIAEVVSGSCDATFYTTGLPNEAFENIDENAPVTLIRVTYPVKTNTYTYDRISMLDYAFQDFDVLDTLHVRSMLVTTKGMELPDFEKFFRFLSLTEKTKEFSHAFDDGNYNTVTYFSNEYSTLWANFSLYNTKDFFQKNPELVNDSTVAILYPFYEITENPDAYISTGTETGSYTKLADDLMLLKNSKGSKYIQLGKKDSTGSYENMSSIYYGESSLAIVQDDVFNYLKNKISDDESLKVWSAKKIVPLYKEYVHLIVNKNAKIALLDASGKVQRNADGTVIKHATQTIKSLSDLKGLKVCLCEKTSGSFISGINLLLTYEFTQTNAPKYFFNSPEIAAVKVASGEYDALIKVTADGYSLLTTKVAPVFDNGKQLAGLDDTALNNAVDSSNVKIPYLGAPGATQAEQRANFTKDLFINRITIIPALKNSLSQENYNTGYISYPGIAENVETTYVRAILIGHPNFNDKDMGKLIDGIYENKASLTNIIASKDCINKAEAVDYFKKNPYGWSKYSKKYFLNSIE